MAVPLPNGTQSLVPTTDMNYDGTPRTGTPITANAAGGNQSNSAVLSGSGTLVSYLQGFAITGAGATAASIATASVAWLGTTLVFHIPVPAGASTSITPLVVNFPTPLPAFNSANTVSVTLTAFGAGNTSASVSVWGFRA